MCGPAPSVFRLLEGAEYDAERVASKIANRPLRTPGFDIHEIQPISGVGVRLISLTKIALPQSLHWEVTAWWYAMMRSIRGY